MNQANCPFCNTKEMRGGVLHKFKHVYASLSHPRKVPGHLLVIPKRHVSKLSELSDDEKKELLDVIIKYQEKLLKYSQGTMIKQNYMPFVPDSKVKVTHLHVHIIPRYLNDALKKESDAVEFIDPDENELNDWTEKLK